MRKLLYIIPASLIIIFAGLYLTGSILAPHAPDKLADEMEKSIAFARRQGAPKYASDEFKDCLGYHKKTIDEWKSQNKLWIIKRDYTRVNSLIRKTTEKANLAGKLAIEKSGSMKQFIKDTQAKLLEKDVYFAEKFRVLPLGKDILRQYSKAHLLLKEGIEASSRGDLSSAYAKLSVAFEDYSGIELAARKKLQEYFNAYNAWVRWYQQTVQKSKETQSYALVVDKMAHKAMLLKDGQVIDKFEVELSTNWLGNKRLAGDKATPEGIYQITRKKNNKDTKYYKALLLNYPNEVDLARFERDVRQGAISPSARIGGLIEIHGDGGKGKDWTEGCVALSNQDIDRLYTTVPSGTTVTIVGSLTPLQELFN
jgi:hypothetical protein